MIITFVSITFAVLTGNLIKAAELPTTIDGSVDAQSLLQELRMASQTGSTTAEYVPADSYKYNGAKETLFTSKNFALVLVFIALLYLGIMIYHITCSNDDEDAESDRDDYFTGSEN